MSSDPEVRVQKSSYFRLYVYETVKTENGKILFTSNINNTIKIPNDKNLISDKTTPRTKDFICPNKQCITNSKKKVDKEAIFFRPDPKSYKLIYICISCSQKWSP